MTKVSVVMPAYNSKKFIARAIESVLHQTFQDWELIVIDDCSMDNTCSIVKELLQSDDRVKLICLENNSGAAVARNAGIQHAKGRYISFLDSDDAWLPYKLEKQLEFIERKKACFAFSAYRRVDESNNVLGVIGVPQKVTYHELLKSCVIGCLTVMYDTREFGKVNMPLINKRQDFGLWLSLLKKTDYAYGQNEVLAEYTVRQGSLSSNKKHAASFQWKIYREVEQLSLFKSCYYFSHYAASGVLRSKFPMFAKGVGVLD